jgi:hypothetical protein
MTAASLTFTGGVAFNFVLAKTDSGWPLSDPDSIEEVLETKGVNGRRWREIFEQHRPFTMVSISEYVDWNAAVNAAGDMRKAVRVYPFAKLIYSHPIRIQGWMDVKCSMVVPVPVNGLLSGAVASSMGSSIRATWILEHTGGFPL